MAPVKRVKARCDEHGSVFVGEKEGRKKKVTGMKEGPPKEALDHQQKTLYKMFSLFEKLWTFTSNVITY